MPGELLDRERALAEAGDLDRVCRAQPLSTTEVFPPNAFYGNDVVLKLYAGLPVERSLKAVVPHGIVFNPTYVWVQERGALLPAVLAYSGYRARAYARATRMLCIRSAVPFAYLPGLLGEALPRERTGTLYFPGHSTHRLTAVADFAGMAEALIRLEPRLHPVTVCIYWRDYELGHHRPFVERGLRVVSAGHMFDRAFLFRLYHLCQAHRYAASNSVGSSLLYAVLAGCRFFLLAGFGVRHSGMEAHMREDSSGGGDYKGALARAFAAPADEITTEQARLVAEVCGLDHLLGPPQLRDALAMADRLDRWGMARDPRGRPVHASFPRAGLRAGRRIAYAMRRLLPSTASG